MSGIEWTPTLYRDLWADDIRLVIDGRDVTYFRDVLAQVGGYQLQEPYAFGPADFALPQVTQFDVAAFGSGTLAWLRHGARCELLPVTGSTYGERLWAGFVTSIQSSADGTAIHCDGELSGRLSLRDRQPPVFAFRKDVGLLLYETCVQAGVYLTPHLGAVTGLTRYTLGGGEDQLSYANDLLAGALMANGDQWTIARASTGRGYVMALKDTTTVHATVFLGAHGVELDVTRDIAEEPTTFYGTGTDPRGQKITNAVIPNLFAGEPADYPFDDDRTFGLGTTDADTDTGAGITALRRKLIGMGFLTRAETVGENVYEDDIADGVEAVQRRANLAVTGNVNPATWRALFNIGVTGRTLNGARVLPMAQLSAVERYLLTSNGSVDSANPDYDPTRVTVDRTLDHGGGVWKEEMLRFSGRLLDRTHAGKNWTGTLALNGADVFAGDVDAETASPAPLSRLDLREGQNVKVVGFDGDTLFHVSGINVGGDRNVSMAVDTRSRDLLTLGQIIARNKESRRSPAREFINSVRRPNAMSTLVVSNELFGLVDDTALIGGQWNQVLVPCGQSGTIDRVRVHLSDDAPAFVMGVTVRSIAPGRMADLAGSDPLDAGSKWAKGHVQHRLKAGQLFLYTAGQASQPLGYYPLAHTDDGNEVTSAPITGDWEDDAGFAFRTFADGQIGGVLYLMLFPDRDCTLLSSKVFFVNQTEGS